MRPEPMFPILNDPIIKCIPWAAIAGHEAQAQTNHGGQTIRGLASRGGLSVHEAFHVISDTPWPWKTFKSGPVNDAVYRRALMSRLERFEKGRQPPAPHPADEGSET